LILARCPGGVTYTGSVSDRGFRAAPNSSRSPISLQLRKADMQAVRSKPSRPALVGRRSDRLRHLAAMRERQPRGQLAGRLLWGLAVEGHHRGGQARLPAKLGAPPVADGRYLYLVRTPADRFFEVVNGQLSGGSPFSVRSDRDFTQPSRAIKRNGSRRRVHNHPVRWIVGGSGRRKICAVRLCTAFSRLVHRFSTGTGVMRAYRWGGPEGRMRG
jgi:hypothetical protein